MIKTQSIKNGIYGVVLNLSRSLPVFKMLLRSQRAATIVLPKEPGFNWHENFITHLAAVLKPKVYVELGLYQCALFNQVIPFADRLIGVDLDPKAGAFMKKSPKARFYAMRTTEYAKIAKKEKLKIDLLFIDADHSKESVLADFRAFFPLVSDQGVILFHDGYPKNKEFTTSGYCGDGYKAIEKLTKNQNGYEMMTIPMHPGVTICRKRKKHLAWE